MEPEIDWSTRTKFILWSDVTIEEEVIQEGDDLLVPISIWTASFEGPNYVDGVRFTTDSPVIRFSRSGPTAQAAAKALTEAAEAQNWEIR